MNPDGYGRGAGTAQMVVEEVIIGGVSVVPVRV